MRAWAGPLLVGLLAVMATVGTAVAWSIERAASAGGDGTAAGAAPPTPVLSVRRVPSVLLGPVADRRLAHDLEAVASLLPPDSCLAVAGDGPAVGHRAEAEVVPASAQKLLVAATAWEVLGPEHRFRTTVVTSAPPVDGVVAGDLVLVGGGDPLLATADYVSRFRRQPQPFTDLAELADAVVAAGVRRVSGAVVGDEGRYDRQRYVAGWPARYVAQSAIGPLSALSLNDGFAAYPTPDAPGVALAPAEDPAQEAASVLAQALEARGVAVAEAARAGAAPQGAVELAAVESVPLRGVLAQLLLESDNSTAELLVKEVGLVAGEGPTTAAGAEVVERTVGGGAVVQDGSGLSLDDRVTCDLLVDLLGRPGVGDVLVASLPVAARSGTLDRRFGDTALEGVLRAKTGSLNTVAALAGVVDDGDPPLRFALVVNVDPPGRVPPSVGGLQQAVGEALVAWPRVPELAEVGPRSEDG